MRTFPALVLIGFLVLSVLPASGESIPPKVEKAIKELLEGKNVKDNCEVILQSSVSGEALYKRLTKPRKYSDKEKKGQGEEHIKIGDVNLKFGYTVPGSYSASKPIPVIIVLHGGVTTPEPFPVSDLVSSMVGPYASTMAKAKEDAIFIAPQGCKDCVWWADSGRDMILGALKIIKRRYNVDTNRVYVSGFSDGGSGSFYCGAIIPTQFASVFPFNGMLSNLTAGGNSVFFENMRNRPFFVVNTAQDETYPAEATGAFAKGMKDTGVDIESRMFEGIGHEWTYMSKIDADLAKWIKAKKRDPHRKTVEWATCNCEKMGRCDWLTIVEQGETAKETEYKPATVQARGQRMFSYPTKPSHVKVVRDGNNFVVESSNVRKFKLGLLPEDVDFKKPVTVTVNGEKVFEGAVEYDARSVVESYAADEDTETVCGKYLEVEVK